MEQSQQTSTRNLNDIQDFMCEVQRYPVVYNKFSNDFKDRQKKENAWKAIASVFGTTTVELIRRYKSIRSSYGRYLKRAKKGPSGSGRKDVQDLQIAQLLHVYLQHKSCNGCAIVVRRLQPYENQALKARAMFKVLEMMDFCIRLRTSLLFGPNNLCSMASSSHDQPPRTSIIMLCCSTVYPLYCCFSSHLNGLYLCLLLLLLYI